MAGDTLPFDDQDGELEDCSAGALRVALAHVQAMIERAQKVEDRLNMTDEKVHWAMSAAHGDEGTIGKARSVTANLHWIEDEIKDELERRDEPFRK